MLVLNSQLINDPKDATEEEEAQAAWITDELSRVKEAKHAICFQHIPWFINQEDEDLGYFNMSPAPRRKWLKKLIDAGVSKVFCGHHHRIAGGFTNDGKLEVVVTSAVGRQMSVEEVEDNSFHGEEFRGGKDIRHGMRIVSVGAQEIRHEYHAFDDLLGPTVDSPKSVLGEYIYRS